MEGAVARADQQSARVAAEKEAAGAHRRRADSALAHRFEFAQATARSHLRAQRKKLHSVLLSVEY